jgi:peptidoglycan/LPS O-acetylase OafA/YrhL
MTERGTGGVIAMPRENNLDFLRLIFAWMVVFVHAFNLSLSAPLAWLPKTFSSDFAVEGFFTLSGCLIVASFDRSRAVAKYFLRRAQRILPAYYLSTILCLGLGIVFTTLPLRGFLESKGLWKFLAANVVFLNMLHPGLPGVFEKNPSSAMNGALWTIKIEVMFYLFVPLFVWLCRRFGTAPVLTISFAASVFYRVLLERMNHPDLARQLPGQLAFFMVGAAVYYYYPLFQRYKGWMWSMGALAYLLSLATGWFALRAIGVPLLVLCAGFLLPIVRGPTRYGDFSYGVYIIHFPIIQALVASGIFAASPYGAFAIVLVMAAPLSVLSWNLVEKRFLGKQRLKAMEARPAW